MSLSYQLDKNFGERAAFGLIVLQADLTIEPELSPLFNDRLVPLYHTRMSSHPVITPETLAKMPDAILPAVQLFPKEAHLNVVGFACTSGATYIGSEKIEALVQTILPDVLVTDPLKAVIAACRALNVTRLGFISPYVAEVSLSMRARLADDGIEVSTFSSFNQEQEHLVAQISEQSVLDAIVQMGKTQNLDAIFASCTNLRTLNILEEAERQIGIPVLSSNQVLAWDMLKRAGLSNVDGPGRLFRV